MHALKLALYTSFIWGFINSSADYATILHIKIPIVKNILSYIPLPKYKLGWISIAILATIASFIWRKRITFGIQAK